jgi:formylglycine-generating enzyme required for sulfatase activity
VFGEDLGLAPYEEQLVVLSPFFIDRTETTVGDVLRSGLLDDPDELLAWSGDEEGAELASFRDWCTFSGNEQRLDLPVNCATTRWARDYCLARGADLPSEAQVDYLMGGLASRAFPWGSQAECGDAALAQLLFSLGDGVATVAHLECGQQGAFSPFSPVASSARDRVEVADGFVEDIVGNAAELTRDHWSSMAAPCWGRGYEVDPVCETTNPDADLVVRGGAISAPLALARSTRAAAPLDAEGIDVTFRCARSGDNEYAPRLELEIVLGQGCSEDTDCGEAPGARCITTSDVDWPGGGVVGGYCTRECGQAEDCGPQGECVLGVCLLRCDVFEPKVTHLDDPLPANKCHGRRDLVCRKITSQGFEVCLGACSSDSQCEPGDHCDRKLGGCRATPSPGLADGLPCDSDPDCQGFCVGAPGKAFCASGCSAGGELDSEDCGGSANGLCIQAGEYGAVGSLGFCYRACEAHSDCYPPTNFCEPTQSDPGYVETPWWDVTDAVCREAATCAYPGNSCGGGLTCQVTADGNYCLSPSIPF